MYSRVDIDIAKIDPLIIYRCKNPQCRQVFNPQTMMNDAEKKVSFECPICGSKYEAQFRSTSINNDQEAIMLLERPRLIDLGTRIASS